jgi:hypothetical protein
LLSFGTQFQLRPWFSRSGFNSLERRVGDIGEAVARLEGANSATKESKYSPFLITLFSFLGFAVISYWTWIGAQVVHQGKQIDAIILNLDPSKALQNISQLNQNDFAKALSALQRITATRSEKPIPQPIIQAVAQRLQSLNESSPEYWPTVLQFIHFASSGASPDVPPPGAPNWLISNNSGDVSPGTVSNRRVLLDGGDLVDTHFDHCRIFFTEHPVHMRNVVFTDSVFEMPVSATPSQYIKDAGRLLLASDLKSVTALSL